MCDAGVHFSAMTVSNLLRCFCPFCPAGLSILGRCTQYGQHNLEKGTYIYIAVGYGVGAGIIVDGKIFHGASGVAGEIGHMSINFHGPRCVCGNRGCLKMYASSYAVAKAIAKDKVINQSTKTASTCDFDSILEAYQQGNPLAIEVIQKAGEYLGIGIVNLINVYNPNGIILGDDLAKIGKPFLDCVQKTIKEHTQPELYQETEIRLTSFSQDPAIIGAGAVAIDQLLKTPTELLR
ncbi:ROK family protein [Subdoligranulum sp. AF14-43]|nr:ROK family protein [Subdoligranulum sp. AF14-43]